MTRALELTSAGAPPQDRIVMRPKCSLGALVAVAALAVGCGESAVASLPPEIAMTDSGLYRLTASSDPNPPVRGANRVTCEVVDLNGAAVDGLQLEVVPFMPSHGHGTSVEPTITALGQGRYQIDHVLFYMPGHWELRTTFRPGGDHVVLGFDIP
jgi:YtkA-like protein